MQYGEGQGMLIETHEPGRRDAAEAVSGLLQVVREKEFQRDQMARSNQELSQRFKLFQGFVEEMVEAGHSINAHRPELPKDCGLTFAKDFNDQEFVLSDLVQVDETHNGMAFDYYAAGYAYGVNGVRKDHMFFLINGVPLLSGRDVPAGIASFGTRFNDDRTVYGKIVAAYSVATPPPITRYEDWSSTLDDVEMRFAKAATAATRIRDGLEDQDLHGDITASQWRPHIFEITFNTDGTSEISPDSALHPEHSTNNL